MVRNSPESLHTMQEQAPSEPFKYILPQDQPYLAWRS